MVLGAGCEREREELPECTPSIREAGRLSIDVDGNTPDNSAVYELSVVEATESLLRLEANSLEDPPDEEHVEVELRGQVSDRVRLPEVGDQAVVRGGAGCLYGGYVRVSSPEGDLLLEAGLPYCVSEFDTSDWQPPPFFGMRPAPDPQACGDDCTTAVMYETTLSQEGEEELLLVDEPREVTIDGRRYLAEAQLARSYSQPCIIDGGGVHGGAYLAPLDE